MMNLLPKSSIENGKVLIRRLFLGHVAETSSFDQVVQVFGQVRGVVACPFQCLRHQENFKTRCVSLRNCFGEVFLEEGMAHAVDIFIHLEDFSCAIQIEGGESGVNEIEHVPQNAGHLDQLAHVRRRDLRLAVLNSESNAHDEISNTLEVSRGFQARKELPGTELIHTRDGRGKALVDLPFDLVEFLFTLLDCKEGHAGGVGKQVPYVKGGIPCDEAGPEREIRQIGGAAAGLNRDSGSPRAGSGAVVLGRISFSDRLTFARHLDKVRRIPGSLSLFSQCERTVTSQAAVKSVVCDASTGGSVL